MRRVLLLALVFAVISSSCGSTVQNPGVKRSTDVITAEEIAGTPAQTDFQAIQSLRPELLNYRGLEPSVYVDNLKQGGVAFLHSISVTSIKEIKFLKPDDATFRLGTGHMGGAFMIKTK